MKCSLFAIMLLLMVSIGVASAQTNVFVATGPALLRNADTQPFIAAGVTTQPREDAPVAFLAKYQHTGGGLDDVMGGVEITSLIHPSVAVGAYRLPTCHGAVYKPAVEVGADFLRVNFMDKYGLSFGATATKIENVPVFVSGVVKLSLRLN